MAAFSTFNALVTFAAVAAITVTAAALAWLTRWTLLIGLIAWCAAFIPIALWIVLTKPLNWNMSAPMVWSGLAAGALNGFGVIAAFAAYRYEGKASIVTPLKTLRAS